MTRETPNPTRLLLVAVTLTLWAASTSGAAHLNGQLNGQSASRAARHRALASGDRGRSNRARLPLPVSFREEREAGLIVEVWVNGAGPFEFAIDTGAGTTIISDRVAREANVSISPGKRASLAGLTGVEAMTGRGALIRTLALGEPDNLLPANKKAVVTSNLPPSIDGILDPTEAYWPFGYSIDLPNHQMDAFDPTLTPLSAAHPPADGTIVRWLTDSAGRRPFVRLGDGRLALLDTGSSFGLAFSGQSTATEGARGRPGVRDISGGSIISRRVQPSTVSIGALMLRGVPTDVLFGVEKGAPVLLGRDALGPFKIILDPIHYLIAIQPSSQ